MEFFLQELTLAALFTAVLYWVLAISVPFHVGSSSSAGDFSVDPVAGGSAAKDEISSGGLRTVIATVDRYDGEGLPEISASSGGVGSADDAEMDGFGAKIAAEEKGFNDAGGRGSEEIEMAIVEEKCDGGDNLDLGLMRSESAGAIEGLKTSPEEIREGDFDGIGDDWEGIERSDLEKKFARAVNYVEYGRKKKERDNDLGFHEQMQLYGLHRLAVEGPCFEPQPMALKVSARAKWNAWQRLGNISPEAAMEEYIKVLDDHNPRWMCDDSAGRE